MIAIQTQLSILCSSELLEVHTNFKTMNTCPNQFPSAAATTFPTPIQARNQECINLIVKRLSHACHIATETSSKLLNNSGNQNRTFGTLTCKKAVSNNGRQRWVCHEHLALRNPFREKHWATTCAPNELGQSHIEGADALDSGACERPCKTTTEQQQTTTNNKRIAHTYYTDRTTAAATAKVNMQTEASKQQTSKHNRQCAVQQPQSKSSRRTRQT